MDFHYPLGVATAILCGVVIQTGILLQKKVVNDLPPEDRQERFMRTLVRKPIWVAGIVLEVAVGAVTFMAAQNLIGPALVPGLMASGLIVLAVGSVKLIGETLGAGEYAGIALMILGILLLGLSELEIPVERVREALALPGTAGRIAVFSLSLFLLWGGTHLASLRSPKRKGMIMAFSNGFPFCLSNFWISPLLAVWVTVLGGDGSRGEIGLFVLASAMLVGTNLFGIRQTQEAFKFAQASNVIPVQQVTVQVAPVLVYFYVFSLDPPSRLAAALIVSGALLVSLSGFLLGRRQSALEQIR